MKKFIVAIVSILAICGVLVGHHYLKQAAADRRQAATDRRQAATDRRQAAQRMARAEVEVRELIECLKAPPEVIHVDYRELRAIAKLRRQGFQKLGVQEYYPYANQVRPGALSKMRPNSASRFPDSGRSLPATKPSDRFLASTYDQDTSLEFYWANKAARACASIAVEFNKPKSPWQDYLAQHPKTYEQEIRPRLLLLAESRRNRFAIQACKALAAAGERTEFLQQRLTPMALDRSSCRRDEVIKLLKQCGFPVPAPWPTMESLSAYECDAVAGKDALGDPLPAGALLRVGQEPRAGSPQRTCPRMLDGPIDGQMLYLNVSRPDDEHGRYFCRVDIGTGEITRVVPAGPDKVEVAAVSGDGTVLATYGKYATEPSTAAGRSARGLYRLMLWNLETGQPIGEITPTHSIQWLRFDPHHPRLIAGDESNGYENGCMSVYDVSRRQLLYRVPVGNMSAGSRWSMMLVANPDRAVSRKVNGMVMLELVKGRLKAWFERAGMQTVEFNPLVKVSVAARSQKSQWIATFSDYEGGMGVPNGILRIWEVGSWFKDDGRANLCDPKLVGMHKLQVASPETVDWGFTAAAFSPKDEFLLTTYMYSSSIIVWDLKGRPLGRITGHAGLVKQIRFVGDKLVSTSDDTTLLVWDWPKIADWCRRQVKNNKAATRPHP